MFRRYPFIPVTLWLGYLLLALCLFSLPFSPAWKWGTSAAVLIGICIVLVYRQRRCRQQQTQQIQFASGPVLQDLPRDLRDDTPVILVCRAGGNRGHQPTTVHDGNAVWIDVPESSMLLPVSQRLQYWRSRAPDAVVLGVAPEQSTDLARLQGDLVGWRYAIAGLQRRVAQRIPAYLTLFARLDEGTGTQLDWRGTLISALGRPQPAAAQIPALLQRLDTCSLDSVCGAPSLVNRYNARTQALLAWTQEQALPMLGTTVNGLAPLKLQGVLVSNTLEASVPQHLWAQWLKDRAALVPASHAGLPAGAPLPLPIVPHLPHSWRCAGWLRGLLDAMSFTALAVAAAMAASYLGNERLIQQIRDDIGSYRLTGYQMPGAKLGALRQLQADRDQLLSFARTGVPWRLSWGMYRGEGLLPLLEREIRGYAPPPPPPAMISLDSLSLFDSGKATLKPDANRVLMTALMSITANPEKQALIAGHTDNTGNPAINQKLSEARAIAVRDWFINMSSLPPSHFAVKGFGGSTPLAPNDSVANKARNRRVEITLVPDIPAH